MTGIYKLTCSGNGKFYIGSSKNINVRIRRHLRELELNKHCNLKLQNTYNKYGADSMSFEVLELCQDCVLLEREQYWIDTLNACKDGLNIARKSTGGDTFTHNPNKSNVSALISERMPDYTGNKNNFYGRKHTQELCEIARTRSSNPIKLAINGIEYGSIRAASVATGLIRSTIRNRLHSDNFENYVFL